MHILVLNHRDITNPDSGSAEVLTHEMAKRWVRAGHAVTLFCSKFPLAVEKETIDGVEIVRRGAASLKGWYAYDFYIRDLKSSPDIILDETDILPFFAKLYAPRKTVLLASELIGRRAGDLYPFPVSTGWKMAESLYLSIYQGSPTFVLADTVKQSFVERGFKESYITVLKRGVSAPDSLPIQIRESRLTLIYLGKVNKRKGAEDAIEVLRAVKQSKPDAQLWLAGSGSDAYVDHLRGLIAGYKLADSVSFLGFVSDQLKFELLAKAHILIVPSKFEAWGLTVPEAGIVGTPSVAYATSGLGAVIQHNQTGLLVDQKILSMAQAIVGITGDISGYQTMQQQAQIFARQFNWDTSAATALNIFEYIYSYNNKGMGHENPRL